MLIAIFSSFHSANRIPGALNKNKIRPRDENDIGQSGPELKNIGPWGENCAGPPIIPFLD